MNLQEYIDNLNNFAKEHPEMLNATVIYSKDDEGNGYQEVYYTPTIGQFDTDGEFQSEENLKSDEVEEYQLNAVCIN